MTKLAYLQEMLTAFLTAKGVKAQEAFPERARGRLTKPLVVAGIQSLVAEEAGFQNYLGDRYDEALHRWEERYGQKTEVRIFLELYSPRSQGEKGLRELMDQLAQAFSQEGPAGLWVKELSFGKGSYDRESDLFQAEGDVLCEGLLYSAQDEEGSFLSFEVRGGITVEQSDEP